jgi:hypothetical protein
MRFDSFLEHDEIAPEGATRLLLVTPHLRSKDGAAGNSVELRLKKD